MAGVSDVGQPHTGANKGMHGRGIPRLRKAHRDYASSCVRAGIVIKVKAREPVLSGVAARPRPTRFSLRARASLGVQSVRHDFSV